MNKSSDESKEKIFCDQGDVETNSCEEELDKKPSAAELKEINENHEKNYKKHNRSYRQDKRRSMRKKSNLKYAQKCDEYNDFMLFNLEKKKYHKESPHIVIKKSLRFIKPNSIILKNATINNENTQERTISYEISQIGQNVKVVSKNPKYLNVDLDRCEDRRVFFLVPLKSVYQLPNLVFIDEDNKQMTKEELLHNKQTYVLIGMVDKALDIDNFGECFGKSDIEFSRKVFINQIKTAGSFHFETSGEIFSFGFGPKYYVESNLSLGPFAERKRKLSQHEIGLKQEFKKKCTTFFITALAVFSLSLIISRKVYLQMWQYCKVILTLIPNLIRKNLSCRTVEYSMLIYV